MNEPFCEWEKVLMEHILACGGQCRYRTTMETINKCHNNIAAIAVFIMAVLTSRLDGTFVRLCTGVTEEHLFHASPFT